MPNPGDIVIVDFMGAQGVKRRPTVVVSTTVYHSERPDIIIALLTGNIDTATKKTDYILQDWNAAGLSKPSAFRAYLYTMERHEIIAEVGRLSERDWKQIQNRLAVALAVP